MARTLITDAAITVLESQGMTVAADAADLAGEAGDEVNGNETPCTGAELIAVTNTDVGAQTVTFTAAPDSFGRTGAITAYSIGAGETAIFGVFKTAAWKNTDGMLYIDVSDPAVEIAVIRARP